MDFLPILTLQGPNLQLRHWQQYGVSFNFHLCNLKLLCWSNYMVSSIYSKFGTVPSEHLKPWGLRNSPVMEAFFHCYIHNNGFSSPKEVILQPHQHIQHWALFKGGGLREDRWERKHQHYQNSGTSLLKKKIATTSTPRCWHWASFRRRYLKRVEWKKTKRNQRPLLTLTAPPNLMVSTFTSLEKPSSVWTTMLVLSSNESSSHPQALRLHFTKDQRIISDLFESLEVFIHGVGRESGIKCNKKWLHQTFWLHEFEVQ